MWLRRVSKKVLESANGYRLFQQLVRKRKSSFLQEVISNYPTYRVLDIGCGEGASSELFENSSYFGFDPDEKYIECAKALYQDSQTVFSVGSVENPPQDLGAYDFCLAKGVLHHLDDMQAACLFEVIADALDSGGIALVLDPVRGEGSAIARFIISMDRGECVRRAVEYRSLAAHNGNLQLLDSKVISGHLRVPYVHHRMVLRRV